jgi:hypothetical protein
VIRPYFSLCSVCNPNASRALCHCLQLNSQCRALEVIALDYCPVDISPLEQLLPRSALTAYSPLPALRGVSARQCQCTAPDERRRHAMIQAECNSN